MREIYLDNSATTPLCTDAIRVMTEAMEAVITEAELEGTQLLCARNAISSSQIIAQISNSRRTVRLSLIFLYVAVFSLLLSNFYTTERVVEYPRLSARMVVLNYVHSTDGKK